ncbi:maestro heat-like repeat family member 5 isoform X2 [Ornithorhynchus anatinus]|uniref:maestro heat-like repeat family member 5 isoform X2 n=1 Tax=Ornithorhynchus anatinus TaxID=9258 RepID=UPI0019D44382|nr:maestro heat-like repeat family member 5 isoform X2 [Ornithorhynchus anatinus]XP_039766993.1 maestro heat-like repeat family member 5 isoform X2 [Ornithorhynchus anatinus]
MGRKGSAQKGFLPLARVAPAPEETEVKLEVMSNERCFELVLDELYGVQSHGDLVAWVRNLTSAHLSFLSLKVLIGLRSSNLTRVAHAVRILSILLQVPKALDDQAADLARSVYEQLISSGLQAEKNLLQEALALLGRHHTREIVQVFLEYSRPLNREVLEVLKCVGADASIASLVLWALLRKVFGRPQREESNCTKWERHTLSSIAAVNTLYELLFVVEYSGAVAQLLPQLFLAFIIQIQYVLELGLVGERVLLAVQPTVPSALSPWRTALEALRGLLSKDVCVGCWQSFTSMELQDGWQLFWSLETFQEGVALLARTLVQSRCPMVAELLQTVVSSLLGKDRQGRSVAVGLLAELIWIPALKTVVDPKVVRFILQEGLEDPDPVVRVISLQALTSLPLNPNKRPMLLAQLPFFLEGFYREDQEGALAAMDAAILTARNLGSGGLGRLSKDIIRMLGPFFDDERAQVRVAALELLAAVAGGCVKEKKAYLQQELICCLLPVLLHLKDEHPTVGKKARYTFFWLARSIGWSYTEEVGWALSWEESENTAYGAIWKALMESFKDSLPIFLTQALAYTNCPQPDVKFAAVVFLVYTSTIALKSPLFSEEVLEILFQKIHYLEKDPSTKIRRFLRFYKRILAENDGLFF